MEAVLLLISFGADVNGATDERHDFRTVLHYAVLSGNHALVTLLLRQGARVAFDPDYRKPTPLDLAILKGDPGLVKILVDAGKVAAADLKQLIPALSGLARNIVLYALKVSFKNVIHSKFHGLS